MITKTVWVEIPVEITFSVDPGQRQTWEEPGYGPQIEDIRFNNDQVISALEHEIYGEKSTIPETLMNEYLEDAQADKEYWAEQKYNEKKEPF